MTTTSPALLGIQSLGTTRNIISFSVPASHKVLPPADRSRYRAVRIGESLQRKEAWLGLCLLDDVTNPRQHI
jgi:hypothetical protein